MNTAKIKKIKKIKILSPFPVSFPESPLTAQTLPEDKKTLLTREGLKTLKEELDYLKETRRKEIAERIKEAISYGDLSENSEYEEAKNEQAFIEGRILELEDMIKNAQIIDDKHATSARIVQLGAKVTLRNLSEANKVEEYTLVGSTESDALAGKISNESPLGMALLEKTIGDLIEFIAPMGIRKYEIVSIK